MDRFYNFLSRESYRKFLETGAYSPNLLSTPKYADRLIVKADFESEITGKYYFLNESFEADSSGTYLHVSSSSKDIRIGHYIVFHVKSNFHLDYFHWIITSKDLILKSGNEYVGRQENKIVFTFSLVVSSQMAPTFFITVFKVYRSRLISDSAKIRVNSINRREAEFRLSQTKDHGMWTVEASCRGIPGSIFMMASIRQKTYDLGQGKHLITEEKFMDNFSRLERFADPLENLHIMSETELAEDYQPPLRAGGKDEADICNDDFLLSRENRFNDFYDVGDGDWGYKIINMDEDGERFITLDIPESPDDWYFFIVNISPDEGITFLIQEFSTERPLDFYCEAPEYVRRGENFGIRCIMHNRMDKPVEAVLRLLNSEDFRVIEVEPYGYVKSYAPRLSGGERHHLIYVRPGEHFEVHFPIAPVLQSGSIVVDIEMLTQMLMVSQSIEVDIRPEGSSVLRHTSFMLDLKNRANVLKFANIVVDETPVIPYEVYRRYIFGSPRGKVTVSGDVIGPVFPLEKPVSIEILFPSGRSSRLPSKGTEFHLFNLGANALQLHYMRLTNQIPKLDGDLVSKIFEKMNLEFLGVMRRYSSRGWLKNLESSSPSVMLTAWALYIFHHVIYQDWEEFIYLDRNIMSSSILWLINYQTLRGDFIEYTAREYSSPSIPDYHLTSFVLISLEKICPELNGDERQYCFVARRRAKRFLEEHLKMIKDVTNLSITAYALALSKSDLAAEAHKRLWLKARRSDGKIYWSRSPIRPNRIRYEFNRPFLEAKAYQDQDAEAVQTTSYALLTSLLIEGIGVLNEQDQIIHWLNSMRLDSGGFISLADTILALNGLIQYSYNSRMMDVTDLKIEIDIPQSNITEEISIKSENIYQTHIIDIPNVYGHVNLYARGSGQAVAQLSVEYGVDFEPYIDKSPQNYFDLTIKEFYSGRNKSEIKIKSCFKWLLTNESHASGPAMLVIDIPTGYIINQPDANRIVRSAIIPEMEDADVTRSGKTIWYFKGVPSKERCFSHLIRRYFPVSNHTRTRQALIIEPGRPERFFIRSFNSTSLHVLSICEVCGSYQCPFCPFYSNAYQIKSLLYVVTAQISLLLLSYFSNKV